MLSFVAALLRSDSQQYATEFELQERAKIVFADCDGNSDGKLTKQDIYNYLGLSKYSRILAGELGEPVCITAPVNSGTEQISSAAAELKQVHQNVNFSSVLPEPLASQPAPGKPQALSAGAALDSALSSIADAGNRPGGKASATSCTMKSTIKSTMRSTGCSVLSANHSILQPGHTTGRQTSRLAATRRLEKEQAERAERIRARNLHTAMQPLKQVLYQIDESGSGRMSYHDFYLFLERTNPHMLPAASSTFFTLDRRMDGEVRYKDILRVLYPQALDKDLAEMLSVVTPKKQVKGHNNLEQQIAELKEVFAVYDEDGTGQLEQAEFVEAIVSAGYEREEAMQMFDIVDADHGGSVSLEEFMDWFLHNETGKDKTRRDAF